jgi:putative endonuclease
MDQLDLRRRRYRSGHWGERLASLALMLKGYRIVARRYKTALGEIDLIARRGSLVAMVEVKVRPTLTAAMEAISPGAERRIEAAGDIWLSQQKDHSHLSIRYDLVAVLPRRWPVHVENIFQGRR